MGEVAASAEKDNTTNTHRKMSEGWGDQGKRKGPIPSEPVSLDSRERLWLDPSEVLRVSVNTGVLEP